MSAVSDKWQQEVEGAYNSCDSSANSIKGAAVSEYLRVTRAREMSRERVNLIARRALQAEQHDPSALFFAEPLLAKDMLRILYREDQVEKIVDARIQDPQDMEQLELYRVNEILFHRLRPPSLNGSCTVQ